MGETGLSYLCQHTAFLQRSCRHHFVKIRQHRPRLKLLRLNTQGLFQGLQSLFQFPACQVQVPKTKGGDVALPVYRRRKKSPQSQNGQTDTQTLQWKRGQRGRPTPWDLAFEQTGSNAVFSVATTPEPLLQSSTCPQRGAQAESRPKVPHLEK